MTFVNFPKQPPALGKARREPISYPGPSPWSNNLSGASHSVRFAAINVIECHPVRTPDALFENSY